MINYHLLAIRNILMEEREQALKRRARAAKGNNAAEMHYQQGAINLADRTIAAIDNLFRKEA